MKFKAVLNVNKDMLWSFADNLDDTPEQIILFESGWINQIGIFIENIEFIEKIDNKTSIFSCDLCIDTETLYKNTKYKPEDRNIKDLIHQELKWFSDNGVSIESLVEEGATL